MILLMLCMPSAEIDLLVLPARIRRTVLYYICNLSPQQTRREVIDFWPEEIKEQNKYQSKQQLRMSTTASLRRVV